MKTIKQINKKIKQGKAIIMTASEIKKIADKKSLKKIAEQVDVVTTATFSPMCSSGIYLNLGHTKPQIKMEKVFIDDVSAYGGLAAVDVYLGATQVSRKNSKYGGAHVIHKLIKGEKVNLEAYGKPTDCYPEEKIKSNFRLSEINQAYFFNPRNCSQNYNAATNSTKNKLKTYMGVLLPHYGNINFAGAGDISPLLNDPYLKTIGIGTRILLSGAPGYISWEGTQFNNSQQRDPKTNIPVGSGATLALTADLRKIDYKLVKPLYMPGYGVTIYIGVGIPIPVLDEDIAKNLLIKNKNIKTRLIDYGTGEEIKQVDYEQLFLNKVTIGNKTIKSRSMSDIKTAKKIMINLKDRIKSKKFFLTEPVEKLPIFGSLKNFPQ